MTEKPEPENQQLSFRALLMSVLSAFIGIQSNANRERDFSKGKLSHFIIIGLILALAFILIVVSVVNLVMNLAGA